jgi:hypothetical protein
MPHPLQQKVHQVAQRARRLVLIHALAIVSAVVLVVALGAGVADFLIRYHDFGVRLIVSAAVFAVCSWFIWYYLTPAWRYRPGDVETAQRIERWFPQLRDRLSSSIAFLSEPEDDVRAGSVDLRRAVVNETTSKLEQFDIQQAIEPRATYHAVATATVVFAFAVTLTMMAPESALLAARRLVMPWRSETWPLWNDLVLKNPPQRIAKGENFEVELYDKNGRLPENAQIQYWHEGDHINEIQTELMKTLGDTMLARRENVTRPFRFRAIGGDDHDMAWIPLEVVDPPQIDSLEVKLHPPAYTGWSTEEAPRNFRALEGTQVTIAATASKPLRDASISVETSVKQQIPLTIGLNKHAIELSDTVNTWRISASGSWRLLMTDETGVQGGRDTKFEFQAIPDRPPSVSLEGDNAVTYVTPRARVKLRGWVKDDLAVHRIRLNYLSSARSDANHQTLDIFVGPDASPRTQSRLSGGNNDQQIIDYDWDLAKLAELTPGVQLTYFITATDYKPQDENSDARRLVLITDGEFEDRISGWQSDILTRLAEALDKQRGARAQISSLQIQMEETGALAPSDLDHLQSAELNQRQIQNMLSEGSDAVTSQVAELLSAIEDNRLDSPEVARRMNQLLSELQRIGKQHLPMLQSDLIEALKEAQAGPSRSNATTDKLHTAGEHQDAIIAAMEGMLGELSQWDNYRRVARDMHRLRRDQDDIASRTEAMRLQTLGKDENELTTQERAGLKRLSHEQAELARHFEQLQGRMSEMAAELTGSDPLVAETLADAVDAATGMALSGKMHESSRNVAANRLGQASSLQKETDEGLEELLNVLSSRRENELSRIAKKLRTAEIDLQELRNHVKGLRRKTEQATDLEESDRQHQLKRLEPEQRRLAEQLDRLSRRLERLHAERASLAMSQSAGDLSEAAEQSLQGNANEALNHAEDAEQGIERALKDLREAIAQAEQDLFFEQMAKFEQALTGMISRQKSVVAEIERLDAIVRQGDLSRGQRVSVLSLASVERALAEEAGQFAEKIAKARAFEFGMHAAIREMLSSAIRLDQGKTDDLTQQAAQAAHDRLVRLAEALRIEPQTPNGHGKASSQSPNEESPKPPSDGIAILAELKLLQLFQEEINRRTAAIEDQRDRHGTITPDQEQLLIELAREQGRLAELLLNLSATEDHDNQFYNDTLKDIDTEKGVSPAVEAPPREINPDGMK